MSFKCTVVSPEQQRFDGPVNQAILPAHDGLLGILTNRAPLLVKLGAGPLRLDKPDGTQAYFFVAGGVAQMKNNVLTVLSTEATPVDELDYNAAVAAYEEARQLPATDEKLAEEREKKIERARAKQAMAKK